MTIQLRGRQTQFYIDLVYGVAFSVGFGYLLFLGMDPRVAAFEGGLVLGYFLRVWENMSIYEQVLEEEVAGEAEEAVAAEVEEQVPVEAEQQVSTEVEDQLHDEVAAEVEDQIGDVDERIDREVEAQVSDRMEDLEK